MKLYYSRGACSLAVRILLHEMGLPCEFEKVDLKTKKTETGQDFLEINPKGQVPTLVLDDEEVLTENALIHQYLADKYNNTQLLPAIGDFRRYRVLEAMNFVTTDLHKGFGPLFNSSLPDNIKDEFFKPKLIAKARLLDEHFGRHQYLYGDTYTLGDGYLFTILRWYYGMKVDISDLKNVQRYYKILAERPSIAQSLKEEGLSI